MGPRIVKVRRRDYLKMILSLEKSASCGRFRAKR